VSDHNGVFRPEADAHQGPDEAVHAEEEERLGHRREVARRTRGGIIERAKRRNRVLELRAAGLTEAQIAEQLSMSQSNVSRSIQRALTKWAEQDAQNVEQVRAMKLFELDQLKRAIWARALKGDLNAVREAAKIIGMQSRIAGADSPVKIERHTTVEVGIDTAEIDRMESAWLASGGDVIDGTAIDDDPDVR
jgi:predicted transcriptional regulator